MAGVSRTSLGGSVNLSVYLTSTRVDTANCAAVINIDSFQMSGSFPRIDTMQCAPQMLCAVSQKKSDFYIFSVVYCIHFYFCKVLKQSRVVKSDCLNSCLPEDENVLKTLLWIRLYYWLYLDCHFVTQYNDLD